jgi:hypothetical protein
MDEVFFFAGRKRAKKSRASISVLGQNAKYLSRIDVFRLASDSDIARRDQHFAFVPIDVENGRGVICPICS